MARSKKLVIAVPKGSLGKSTLEKFTQLHLAYDLDSPRPQFEFKWKGYDIIVKVMRAQSIPRTILNGAAHIGITGEDCVEEDKLERVAKNGGSNQRDVVILRKLHYNKQSLGYVSVVAARREDDNKEYGPESKIKIVSEFPRLTHKFYPEAEIQNVIGGAEDEFVAHNEFDLCVTVTETGSGLERRNLQIEQEFLRSTTVLIVKKPENKFELFARRLVGLIDAPDYTKVQFNISIKSWNKVGKTIPALLKPNVHFLSNTEMCSVETIVKSTDVHWLMEKVIPYNASGFVETQPYSVIP